MSRTAGWLTLLLVATAAGARASDELTERLQFVVQWDAAAFYLGARLEDINVVGRHTELDENVRLDDDLEVFLDLGNRKPDLVDDQCYVLAMSAAGGAAFLRGTGRADTPWLSAPPVTPDRQFIRQNLKIHGTLNDPADADIGWSVELRLPWKLLGRDGPPADELWGFNLVRHLRGERDARFSLAPQATILAGELQPKRWGWIRFRDSEDPWVEAGEQNVIIAPRVRGEPAADGTRKPREPVIDGVLSPGEWPFGFQEQVDLVENRLLPLPPEDYPQVPALPQPLPPECDDPPLTVAPRGDRGPYRGDRLVVATYLTSIQDDARLPGVPRIGTRAADGSVLLACQPAGGLGPHVSSLHAGWHKEQLQAAAEVGIDAVLVEYWGDRASRASWSDAMLASLAVALHELEAQNLPHPEIGLRLPLEALSREIGGVPDLTQPTSQAALYRMVRDFFLALPPTARTAVPDGGLSGCLVALEQPPRELRATAGFMAYCEQRLRDEHGLDLLWVGSRIWGRRRVPVDALVIVQPGGARLAAGSVRARAASLGPGYDDSLVAQRPRIDARRASRTLRERFRELQRERFDWLLFGSWNDYSRGDNLAASREYGSSDAQAAAAIVAQFSAGLELDWSARVRWASPPPRIAAGGSLDLPVTVVNSGLRAWTAGDAVQVGARWYHGEPRLIRETSTDDAGRTSETIVADASGRPLELPASDRGGRTDVLFGADRDTFRTVLPLTAIDDQGRPLAPGRYRVRLDGVAGLAPHRLPRRAETGEPLRDAEGKVVWQEQDTDRWFAYGGDDVSEIDLEVVAPEAVPPAAGSVLQASLPGCLETGQTYPITVTVRNEGTEPWSPNVRLGARFERVNPGEPCRAEPPPVALTEWLPLAGILAAADLDEVPPGRAVSLPARLPVADADGQPLPLDLGPLGRCRISFALLGADGRPLPAESRHEQTVRLIDRDWGAGFGAIEVAGLMLAGRPSPGVVTVQNTAFTTWAAGETAVVWHWYRQDGIEVAYEAGRQPLASPVDTGEQLAVPVEITPPTAAGAYTLVFDLAFADGTLASRQPSTFSRQTARLTVAVGGGRYAALDLGRQFNVKAQSSELDPAGGDFDGHGRSLPAEEMPPFADDLGEGLYPTGFLGPPPTDPAMLLVPFWYPDPVSQPLGAIRPTGQAIAVQPGAYRRLHLLAASVEGLIEARLQVRGESGSRPLAPVAVASWDTPPGVGARIGFSTRRRHGPGGVEAKRCWLHHLVIDLPAERIAEIQLPAEPRLRVLAMTLERADAD